MRLPRGYVYLRRHGNGNGDGHVWRYDAGHDGASCLRRKQLYRWPTHVWARDLRAWMGRRLGTPSPSSWRLGRRRIRRRTSPSSSLIVRIAYIDTQTNALSVFSSQMPRFMFYLMKRPLTMINTQSNNLYELQARNTNNNNTISKFLSNSINCITIFKLFSNCN